MICFVICFYQIIKICENYFSFETLTTVRYINEMRISLPGITICFDKIHALREDFKQKHSFKSNESQKMKDILDQMTVEQQFIETISFKEFTNNSCKVIRPIFSKSSKPRINCERITPATKSIDTYNICFTLFSQLNSESNDRYVVDIELYLNSQVFRLFGTEIVTKIPQLFLHIHSRNQLPLNIYKSNFDTVRFRKGVANAIKYQKSSVKSLTKPYETNCYDFRQIGFNSRKSCFEECQLKSLEKQWLKHPGLFVVHISSNKIMVNMFNESNVEQREVENSVAKKCRQVCPLINDCYREYFTLTKYDQEIYRDQNYLIIDVPDLPEISIRHSPKIYFEEFISFIGSLISLWFGFSIIMLSKVVSNLIKSISIFSISKKTSMNIKYRTNNFNVISNKVSKYNRYYNKY